MFPLRDDNPTARMPVVTIALIGACALVFLWQFQAGGVDLVARRYGLTPGRLFGVAADPYGAASAEMTVLTSMFLHGGFMHLAGNMLFLWIFGDNVEDATGRFRFLLFYLLAGAGAAATQVAVAPASDIPMIGASGAVSGVLGAYLLLHPRARVLTLVFLGFFITTIRIRAWVLLAAWFGGQTVSALAADPGAPGVAWFAHVGGFLAGVLLIPFFKRGGVPWFHDGGPGSDENRRRLPTRLWFRRKKKGPWG